MAHPRLVHPLPILYEPIDRERTRFRSRDREPAGVVARAPSIEILGQVSYDIDRELRADTTGRMEGVKGYVLHRWEDLSDADYLPGEGDRIARIGEIPDPGSLRGSFASRPAGLYVALLNDRGHYPDRGGATLVKVYFSDRRPQRADPQ